jgi:hypothetical protein
MSLISDTDAVAAAPPFVVAVTVPAAVPVNVSGESGAVFAGRGRRGLGAALIREDPFLVVPMVSIHRRL